MKFSIIIPTHNRPDHLQACLDSLTRLNPPRGEWEIIVVCDGPHQAYDHILAHFRPLLPLTHVAIQHAGPATARNTGAQHARGTYLVFLDDDCVADNDWLCAFEAALATSAKDALGGSTRNASPHAVGACAWQHLVEFLYTYWSDQNQNQLILISNNVVYKREVFVALDGYDCAFPTAASEDRDLSWRLLAHGHSQGYAANALVWHHQPHLTAWRYCLLQYRYGRGAARFQRLTKPRYPIANETFGVNHRHRYVTSLLRYIVDNRVRVDVAIALLLGHLAHLLGKLAQIPRIDTR